MAIGYVLAKDDPYCAIDLERCRDPLDGAINPWALEIMEQLNCYTELSPSGTGVHIFMKGVLSGSGHKRNDVEIYDTQRYMTLRGAYLPGRVRLMLRSVERSPAWTRLWGWLLTPDEPVVKGDRIWHGRKEDGPENRSNS